MSGTAKAGGQHAGRWRKGQSGNPRGRQLGSKHKATLAAQVLLDGEAETLTRRAIELAKGGDMVALRLCLERIIPPRKERPIAIALPALKTTEDLATATAAVLAAVAAGELTPGEAGELAKLVEAHRRVVETVELEARVRRLEEQRGQ